MDARRSYTLRRISQDEFGALFSEYTRLALIYMASSVGDAEGAGRRHLITRIAEPQIWYPV